MKTVLVNLPWRSLGREGVRAGSRWPHLKGRTEREYLPFPFFLAYAAALLKKHSFDAELIDAIAGRFSYGQFFRHIRKLKADILLCETSTVTLKHDLKALENIGKDTTIILCGPDVNIRQPAFLKEYEFIKYVLVGEYEFTLLELLQHLDKGKKLDNVKGVIYRSNGEIKVNPMRPLGDLNDLPWPLREALPMERYNDAPGDIPIPSVQMMASRGCPYRCKFCLWPQVMYHGNHYRTRNIVDVVDEMEHLVRKMEYKSVYFDDDTFNCGKERMLKLCAEIKKRNLNISWAIMARADLMDEEILVNMKEAGLFAVKYGVESAEDKLLDNINKSMSLKKTQEIIKLTKRLGIKTHLTFTFGLPGETKESINKTINFALKMDPESLQFSLATPFPGTAFYKEMKEEGRLLSEDWAEYDGNSRSVISYENLSRDNLEHAIKSAYKRWIMHRIKRSRFDRLGLKAYCYYSLINSLKKYGFFITAYKIIRFTFRYMLMHIREAMVSSGQRIEELAEKNGMRLGRLALICERGSLDLFWGGFKLTRGQGFLSRLDILKEEESPEFTAGDWEVEKTGENVIVLRRIYGGLPLQELWKVTIVDEKQVDWEIDIETKEKTEFSAGNAGVLLTRKYRKWVEEWGEGRFPPLNDHREVELRNSHSSIIGVRGRQMLNNVLPTLLLDLTGGNNGCLPSARNANEGYEARLLEVKLFNGACGNGKYSAGKHRLFSARIKIVEEDFTKCKKKAGK